MKGYVVSIMYFDEKKLCCRVYDKVVVAANGNYDSAKILKAVREKHPEYDNDFYILQVDEVINELFTLIYKG